MTELVLCMEEEWSNSGVRELGGCSPLNCCLSSLHCFFCISFCIVHLLTWLIVWQEVIVSFLVWFIFLHVIILLSGCTLAFPIFMYILSLDSYSSSSHMVDCIAEQNGILSMNYTKFSFLSISFFSFLTDHRLFKTKRRIKPLFVWVNSLLHDFHKLIWEAY